MNLIDSHSHIDFNDFDTDRNAVIQRAINADVSCIIVSSTIAERWQFVKKVCEGNPHLCHPAYGLHPMFMAEHQAHKNNNGTVLLKRWLEDNYSIAIGEIGLDFFIEEADEANKKAQLELFIEQLEIATECKLPVIIHARKSLDSVLKQLRNFPTVKGSIHSFSGSLQQAKQLIDLGFYLSFGGPITYNRATRLQQLIKDLPLDALLIESDSPDQADSKHHLLRNEPAFIANVAEKIAELKQIDIEAVSQETSKNAVELFGLIPFSK